VCWFRLRIFINVIKDILLHNCTYTHTHTHTHTYMCVYIYIKVKWSRYRPGLVQRVGRGIGLLFHDRGTRRAWVISSTPRPHFIPGKDPVPILQEAGWASEPVWTRGKSRPHRDSSPDRSARSSVAIPTKLHGPPPHTHTHAYIYIYIYIYMPVERAYLLRSSALTSYHSCTTISEMLR
jgi:hypothetical protein